MDVKNKKVTILGIGASGIESARFLRERGAEVFLSEGRSTERTEKTKRELEAEGFSVEVGKHTESRILTADLIVISPGIAPSAPVYQLALSAKVPLYSEIEVASWFCEMPTIAVTGTNGKTTVTTLIAKMLSEAGRPAITCGNIGNPFIGEIDRVNREKLTPVIEVSSFQLMNIEHFRPHIGLVLNLDPDHLDWHKDLDEYYGSKFNLFRNQLPDDHAVLNAEDPATKDWVSHVPSRIVYFNQTGKAHENPNVDACLAVSDIFGLDRSESLKSLTDFSGIEHRLEEVPSGDGRRYINDSKSTNISSLVWALQRMPKRVFLILGGKNKGGDFSTVRPLFGEKTKEIILIGEAIPEIVPALKGCVSYVTAKTLREAVETARRRSSDGDIILLSPGCASFDMFINYKDRGEQFKKLVSELTLPCPKPVSVS